MKKIVFFVIICSVSACAEDPKVVPLGEPTLGGAVVNPPDSIIGKYPTPRNHRQDSIDAVRKEEVTFHPDRVVNLIRYLALRPSIRKQSELYSHSRDTIQNQASSVLDEILWWQDGCQYMSLNNVEHVEVFEKRLRHHPELQKYATRILKRNIKSKGFGFYVPGVESFDYYSTPAADSLASRKIRQMLKSAKIGKCNN